VQCELQRASLKYSDRARINLSKYAAGFSIALKVEQEVSPAAKVDWIIPHHLPDTMTLGATAGMVDHVSRDGSVEILVKVKELANYKCPERIAIAYTSERDEENLISGSFGIEDWLDKMEAAAQAAPATAVTGKDLDYTVKFAVTGSAGLTPGWVITNLTGSIALPLKRVDTNTLTLVLTKLDEGVPMPQPVCVTNLPNSQECKPIQRPVQKPLRSPTIGLSPDTQFLLRQQLNNLRLRDILR
jgi:hypothetical protein